MLNYDKVTAFVKSAPALPSLEEIKRGTGLSGQAVGAAIAKLRADGLYPEDAKSVAELTVSMENKFPRVLAEAQKGNYDHKWRAVDDFRDALGSVISARAKRVFPERYQQMIQELEAAVDAAWSKDWAEFGEKLQAEMKELYGQKSMTVWEAAAAVAIRHLKPWHEGAGVKP
jgi:hypothetical protein